jgi:hypothetical protein
MSEGTGGSEQVWAGGYRLSTRALTPDYDQHKRGVMAEAAALRPASEPPRVEARRVASRRRCGVRRCSRRISW